MQVKIINRSKHALPAYETPSSAGLDIRANLTESLTLKAFERILVPTGIFMEIPAGFECQRWKGAERPSEEIEMAPVTLMVSLPLIVKA